MSTQIAERVMCGNEDHTRATRAVARVYWPGGRFMPNTACRGCLKALLNLYVLPGSSLIEGPYAVTITPIPVTNPEAAAAIPWRERLA
jgi:hypothetical protein